MSRRRTLPAPEQIVAALVEIADDGFCRRAEVAQRFPPSAPGTSGGRCGGPSRRGW